MKRIYISLCFLAIAISLCVFEQYTVNAVYKQTNIYINTAIDEAEKQNYQDVKKACDELNEYWEKKQKYMAAMIDHGPLDDASVTIGNLSELAENKSEKLEYELITAKNQIKGIYSSQKITFANVF